jgi:hypothetical protein
VASQSDRLKPVSARPSATRQPAASIDSSRAIPALVLAWLIPGAGHVLIGDLRRGCIFFVVLTATFGIGLAFGGRLFPFQLSEWLVFLAALAEWGLALPRLVAGILGAGAGTVTAITYEYGNTFLMAAGLLNAVVSLDAFDRARGLKGRRV